MAEKVTVVTRPNDPVEAMVYDALCGADIAFVRDPEKLDFYLPSFDVHIECKQYHSDRIGRQMARFDNVIAIQGRYAAGAFSTMISRAALSGNGNE